MIDYLARHPTLDYTCTSYAEDKLIAIGTHSKGFEQRYHTSHPTDIFLRCIYNAGK